MTTPNLRHDSGVQTSNANKTVDGSDQIVTIKAQMTDFVNDFNTRSKGLFVNKTVQANTEYDTVSLKLTQKLKEFAHGEKEFAKFLDSIDEETVV